MSDEETCDLIINYLSIINLNTDFSRIYDTISNLVNANKQLNHKLIIKGIAEDSTWSYARIDCEVCKIKILINNNDYFSVDDMSNRNHILSCNEYIIKNIIE